MRIRILRTKLPFITFLEILRDKQKKFRLFYFDTKMTTKDRFSKLIQIVQILENMHCFHFSFDISLTNSSLSLISFSQFFPSKKQKSDPTSNVWPSMQWGMIPKIKFKNIETEMFEWQLLKTKNLPILNLLNLSYPSFPILLYPNLV